MATKTEAYVDTSALIAFVDRSDSYNSRFRRLFSNPPKLFTTGHVITEGHAWFLRRYDRYRALQFLIMVETMRPLRIVHPTTSDFRGAVEVLRRFSDQNLTMVDALGLHMMDTRSIGVCWSTDFHLALTGVPLVIHQP